MSLDEALDTILAIEALWRERRGRVRLTDLGIFPHRLVRSRGHAALPPERWRAYPGAKPVRHEWLEGV